ARRQMGRSGQGNRGDETRQTGCGIGHYQFHPRTHRRLQDAEIGGVHLSTSAQRLRQDLAPPSARSLLGGQGSQGELNCRPSQAKREHERYVKKTALTFSSARAARGGALWPPPTTPR